VIARLGNQDGRVSLVAARPMGEDAVSRKVRREAGATKPEHAAVGVDPVFGIPLDTEPMEARSADALSEDDGPWQYEPKWDGFRCLEFVRRF